MDENEFARLLEQYLAPPKESRGEFEDVEIVWERDNEGFGSKHMRLGHGVQEHEVEEVIFNTPPDVKAKRSSSDPDRTVFIGRTKSGRVLFVACEDWTEDGQRYLRPITAFDSSEKYWRKQ